MSRAPARSAEDGLEGHQYPPLKSLGNRPKLASDCATNYLLISPPSGGGRRVNDFRTGGLLLYGRHIGGLTASIGTPHTVFDATLNSASALFLKTKAGADVALAGLFALRAGFV